MPKATVRANAPVLREATPHPAEDIRALAAEFEAAWAAESVIFKSSSTDAEANAAAARVREVAKKIVAIPTTDIEMMRLKARVYLWSEVTDFETFAAENEGNGWSEGVLVSLLRDLGADATPEPATMADRAPVKHEEARMNATSPESEFDRRHSRHLWTLSLRFAT